MSILAISVQFYGRPQIMGYVPAANFYPAPKVDSAILKITLYPDPAVARSAARTISSKSSGPDFAPPASKF